MNEMIKPYYEEQNNKIYCGDCLKIMKQLPSESIDLIVTDPPYQLKIADRWGKADLKKEHYLQEELKKGGTVYSRKIKGFMGKEWDVLPSVDVWKECFRVLKSGAFAFIMTTPRQDSLTQILYDLREAGFFMGVSSIYWTYASGFPKVLNISKAIDRRECLKQLTEKLGRKPTKEEFEEIWKNFRKVISKSPNDRPKSQVASGMGFDRALDKGQEHKDILITEATSRQAKELDGSYSGFQPKPAVEIILVVMKPLSEKSYIDQALKNKKGITWFDDCRIPYKSKNDFNSCGWSKMEATGLPQSIGEHRPTKTLKQIGDFRDKNKGRFPANLLVSDDMLNDGKISKSEGGKTIRGKENKVGEWGYKQFKMQGYGDTGSFSRYFDLNKWWEEKIKKLSEQPCFNCVVILKNTGIILILMVELIVMSV